MSKKKSERKKYMLMLYLLFKFRIKKLNVIEKIICKK